MKGACHIVPLKKKQKPAARLFVELLAHTAEDGTPVAPTEFRIFRKGHNDSEKGVFKFSDVSCERVMAAAKKYANDLSIDYGHGMFAFISVDPAQAGKAAGWFKPEVREGELWASQVSWTPQAKQMLLDREYRYISPAFDHSEDGEIHTLRNVALTNIPALHDLEPLMASWASDADQPEEPKMNWKQLLAMLSLGEAATEADAMAALAARTMPLTELLAVTGKATALDAIGVVKAWKVAMEEVPKMHAELSQLKTTALDAERQALIDDGKRRGVVPPAYEPVLKTMELSQLKAFLSVAVPVHGKANTEVKDVTQVTVGLSAEQLSVATMLGLKPEDMAKRIALRSGVVPVGETKEGKA